MRSIKYIVALAVIVAFLILYGIVWITEGSMTAIVAGIFLIPCVGILSYTKAVNSPLPDLIRTIIVWIITICLIVIVWIGVDHWWEVWEEKAEADKIAEADPGNCFDRKSDNWVKTPAGSYRRAGDDRCIVGTPPPPATPAPPVAKPVVQFPDRYTPCKFWVEEIRDLYTDAEAIYALPPGWPREKAVYYSGKGHLVLSGGNIRSGQWEFWSADDPKKVVMIRVFGKQ